MLRCVASQFRKCLRKFKFSIFFVSALVLVSLSKRQHLGLAETWKHVANQRQSGGGLSGMRPATHGYRRLLARFPAASGGR